MANEETLVNGARTVTGDDQISVAGLFLPRGFVGRTIVGSVAGGMLGEGLGGQVGQAAGSMVGTAAGIASSGVEADGLRFVVAVSPTNIHVLHPAMVRGVHKGDYELMHTFDRSHTEVSIKARASIRKLILEDRDADVRIEMEGSRLWIKHANDVFHALMIKEHDHEAEASLAQA